MCVCPWKLRGNVESTADFTRWFINQWTVLLQKHSSEVRKKGWNVTEFLQYGKEVKGGGNKNNSALYLTESEILQGGCVF